MEKTLFKPPYLTAVLFLSVAAFWTASATSGEMEKQVSNGWGSFIHQANAQGSDHAKLADCVTEGHE